MSIEQLVHHLPMGEVPVKGKPTAARFALAANVKHLMETFQKGFDVGLTPVELEKGSGVSAKTIRRIVNPYSDTGPSLETIDQLAAFFRVESWQLLMPRTPMLQRGVVEVTVQPKPPKARL